MDLNAYLLAKIGTDTAENEQHFAEILPKIGNYPTGRLPRCWPCHRHRAVRRPGHGRAAHLHVAESAAGERERAAVHGAVSTSGAAESACEEKA